MDDNIVIKYLETYRPVVVGHRGAAGLAVENSMSALRLALSLGVKLIEIDVRKTVDGEVVVFHDEDLRRLANIDKKVRDLTLSELKNVKIKGEEILTLEEALKEIGGRAGLLIEIKEKDIEEKVIDIVRRLDAMRWVAVISFIDDVLREIKRLEKRIPTGLIYYNPLDNLQKAKYIGASIVLPHHSRATEKHIELAHRYGLKVIAWTVNNLSIAEELVKREVDGIATDYPDMMLNRLKKAA